MIKPIGNKVLIRLEKQKPDSKIILTDETDDKKANWRFFIEGISDDIKGTIGDEVILFNHAHLQGWPECEKWEGKNLRLVAISDIWGVIKK